MRVKHLLVAAALVASAGLSGSVAAHADDTIVHNGQTYHVIARGSVPVSSTVKISRPIGGGPGGGGGRTGCAANPPTGYAEVLGDIDWIAAINNATHETIYSWKMNAQVGISTNPSCVSGPVYMSTHMVDRPVVGSGTLVTGSVQWKSGAPPLSDNRATVVALYYTSAEPFASLGLPVRSQVLGSAEAHVVGGFADVNGNWYEYCNTVTLYFKPTPVGPNNMRVSPVNPTDNATC